MNNDWWVAAHAKTAKCVAKVGACSALGQDYVNGVPRDYEGEGLSSSAI